MYRQPQMKAEFSLPSMINKAVTCKAIHYRQFGLREAQNLVKPGKKDLRFLSWSFSRLYFCHFSSTWFRLLITRLSKPMAIINSSLFLDSEREKGQVWSFLYRWKSLMIYRKSLAHCSTNLCFTVRKNIKEYSLEQVT